MTDGSRGLAAAVAALDALREDTGVDLLTRSLILLADDRTYDVVQVPEWGGAVLVRSLTGAERDDLEASMMRTKKGGRVDFALANFRARLVVRSVVDEEGGLMFTLADVKNLGDRNAAALSRVFDRASELSGISSADMEELAGNSSGDPSDDSISD